MTTKVYKFLIFISVIAMAVTIVGQILWTSYTYSLLRESFKSLLEESLAKTGNDFNRISHQLEDDGVEPVPLSNRIPTLDSILRSEMNAVRLSDKYAYALVNGSNVLYKSYTGLTNEEYLLSPYHKVLYLNSESPEIKLYVVLDENYFSNSNISHLNLWWLVSMIGFFIIVIVGLFFLQSLRNSRAETKTRIRVINNMAHEFKTPIASIKLAAEMLLNQEVSNQQDRVTRYSELIQFEIKRLQRQTEQIQNVVLLEEGQIMLRYDYIHVNEVIHELIDKYLIVRTDFNERLSIDLRAENDMVYADHSHFENVIINLLENAFKYGGDNVQVHVSTAESLRGLIIQVSDDGIGISRKDQKFIFDRFYRVNPGNRHDIKGHGIGLYYVKSILVKMGAEISVNSTLGKGTKFEICFPKENVNHKK